MTKDTAVVGHPDAVFQLTSKASSGDETAACGTGRGARARAGAGAGQLEHCVGRACRGRCSAAFAAGTPEIAQLLARRMRKIGLDRMYYGADGAFDGHPDPKTSWETFRKGIPFTDAVFAQISANVAPYLRD